MAKRPTTPVDEQPTTTTGPRELPLVALRETVIFPEMIVPLQVGREKSVNALNAAVADGGPIAYLREVDVIRLDAPRGRLHVLVDAGAFAARPAATADLSANEFGLGRELFRMFRANAVPAELGAGVL